jgi:hypothetical protein
MVGSSEEPGGDIGAEETHLRHLGVERRLFGLALEVSLHREASWQVPLDQVIRRTTLGLDLVQTLADQADRREIVRGRARSLELVAESLAISVLEYRVEHSQILAHLKLDNLASSLPSRSVDHRKERLQLRSIGRIDAVFREKQRHESTLPFARTGTTR